MLLSTIARPLLGAVIGYCTNYIAVKMLFRPLRPIKLFGRTLPFTPGIIPKGQGRLAKAIGNAVGGELLTQEELESTLLSEETKLTVRNGINGWLEREKGNETELMELLEKAMGEQSYKTGRETVYREVTDRITGKLEGMNLGDNIASQVISAVNEKVQGTLLAMMVNADMLEGFRQPIASKIDDYIAVNGEALISPAVCDELDSLEHKSIGSYLTSAENSGINLTDIIMGVYEHAVSNYLNAALKTVNLAAVAEKKINDFEPEELESLVLSIMKKELSAVVNLGALVGFALGLINLLF